MYLCVRVVLTLSNYFYPTTPCPPSGLAYLFFLPRTRHQKRDTSSVARLLKDKGIGEFIAAAEKLKKKGVPAVFQIAGDSLADGNPAAYSKSELQQIKKSKAVEFLGHQEDIATLFSNSNLVVLPSYREGLPKVLIEAGAAGRAIVTTDVPGCRDAVIDQKTALLVPVQQVNALSDAIESLLADSAKRQQMGREGRQLVEQEMTIEKVVDQHMKIYQGLSKNAKQST